MPRPPQHDPLPLSIGTEVEQGQRWTFRDSVFAICPKDTPHTLMASFEADWRHAQPKMERCVRCPHGAAQRSRPRACVEARWPQRYRAPPLHRTAPGRLVADEEDAARVQSLLRDRYSILRDAFRFYAGIVRAVAYCAAGPAPGDRQSPPAASARAHRAVATRR